MGNVGQQFVSKSEAMCQCLPKALEMVTTSAFESIKTGSDLSGAVSSVVGDVVELQKCMIDNGFNVRDSRQELFDGDLSTKDGWVVVPAAEA